MIPIRTAIERLDEYIAKHGNKTASVEEINKIIEGDDTDEESD